MISPPAAAFRTEEGRTLLAAWKKKQIGRAVFRRVTGQMPRLVRQEKTI